MKPIFGSQVPTSDLPFSPAIRAGSLVFVSGQASVDETRANCRGRLRGRDAPLD